MLSNVQTNFDALQTSSQSFSFEGSISFYPFNYTIIHIKHLCGTIQYIFDKCITLQQNKRKPEQNPVESCLDCMFIHLE